MAAREALLRSLRERLGGCDGALAFWEQGSKAMGRADELSDLDLYLIVAEGAVEEVSRQVEEALEQVAPIDLRLVLPQPTWHGHWQAFYRMAGLSPYLQVDIVLMKESSANWFLEPEIHGEPQILFDKKGLVRPVPTDAAAFAERLAKRLPLLEAPAELFHIFVGKELQRGREVDALSFYQGVLVGRLVEALRIRYSPWRYNFGLRYLREDLPAPVYAQIRSLVYVAGPEELPAKKERALSLLRETLAELKALDLRELLEQAR
ncbi:MAG: nucleotidyltransferase domain-containing protein [Bacillota bacterium]